MQNDVSNKILMVLWEENAPVSSRGLALRCGISVNTVRKEISRIDAEVRRHGLCIESKTSVGHYLKIVDSRAANLWMSRFQYVYKRTEHLPNAYSDDVRYLLRRLLCAAMPVSGVRLCEELYCSQSTLWRNLKKVGSILKPYGLSLMNRRGDGFWVSGNEWDLRQCLIYQKKIYTLEMLDNQHNESGFPETFFIWNEGEMYEQIYQKIVADLSDQRDFTIPFLYISTIADYIFLARSRTKRIFDKNFTPQQKVLVSGTKELLFAERLCEHLPERLAESLHDYDVIGIAVLLLCYETKNRNLKNLPVYKNLREEACEILKSLRGKWLFFENDQDEEMMEQFICYLYALRNRHTFHVLNDPEAISFVRHKGLFTSDMCLWFFRYYKEVWGITLNKYEKLGAFYVFMHMRRDEKHGFHYIRNALLVSRYGADYARAMTDKIIREYASCFGKITCMEFSELQENSTENYDLLITDLNAQEVSSLWFSEIPTVSVDFFMGKEGCAKLEEYMKTVRREREELYLNRNCFRYTHLKSKEEILAYCGACWGTSQQQEVAGHLWENDEYGILEREQGVVFLPVLLDVGPELRIFVMINDNPVIWNENASSVFVCYNHIEEDDKDQALYGILEHFVHISVSQIEKLIYDRESDPVDVLYGDN